MSAIHRKEPFVYARLYGRLAEAVQQEMQKCGLSATDIVRLALSEKFDREADRAVSR